MSESAPVLVRTICIDTLTGIMNEAYMTDEKKANHDKWFDYGKGVWKLITDLNELGFETVLIIGEPGTGKSTGMRNFPHNTNIWYNADKKNPIWAGGKEEYGTKHKPRAPFHVIPRTYDDIISNIKGAMSMGAFEEERFAILTGHIEDIKTGGGEIKNRLQVLGKVATKMQLEARLETVLYSAVQNEGGVIKYVLHTQNSGTNTARSPMGVFEPIIENDYNEVIQKLLNY